MVDAAVAEISQQIIRESKRRIGDAAEMQAVILVGGGAALMSSCLKEAFPHPVSYTHLTLPTMRLRCRSR
ncbi:hypothetical protein ACM9NO_30120, partial [Pseudomonas paraeruginosa]